MLGGHEFFRVCNVVVQKLLVDGSGTEKHSCELSLADIREASQGPPRYVPKRGTRIHSKTRRTCVLLYANRHPDMTKYYKHAMSTPLREIRSRRVWHILFSWHFYVHVSTASESLAESVG